MHTKFYQNLYTRLGLHNTAYRTYVLFQKPTILCYGSENGFPDNIQYRYVEVAYQIFFSFPHLCEKLK